MARLLATGAEVLLFDEPLSGLDRNALEEILPVIRRLAEGGKTICIIEHNLDVIKSLCDTLYFLDEGRTMAVGTPDMALMHAPRLLILDEPSIGLAPNLVERVMSSIKEINERFGTTILMIEQNVPLSLPIAHRAAVFKTGKVVYEGAPEPLGDHVKLMQLF